MINDLSIAEIVAHFQLNPHPEGGYYKETYRSSEMIEQEALPARFDGDRPFATAIYFLLDQGNFSGFHRIKSDETWHFYAGDPLLVYVIHPNGSLETIGLGQNIMAGEIFQATVPAGCWFASEPAPESRFSFVGCTVSPGFDFMDFELAEFNSLAIQYPQHSSLLQRLCRE